MNNNENKRKLTDSLLNTAKKISDKTSGIKGSIDNYFVQKKFEKYIPISESDLFRDELCREKVIRVADSDPVAEKMCADSAGFYEKIQDKKLITVFTKNIEKLGLSFYPQLSEAVFIADPCKEGCYIELGEYFNYMKQVRVNELTLIAQSLNAKHIDIRLRAASKKTTRVSFGFGFDSSSSSARSDTEKTTSSESSVEIWASTDFAVDSLDDEIVAPQLLYFKNDADIQSLIKMRMNDKNKITKRTYSLKASSSSGMRLDEAMKISAIVNGSKLKSVAAFEKSAKDENEALLEYTIEF